MAITLTRRAAFWIAFALISAGSAVFAWRLFPEALPLIHLDVKMTRAQALASAAALAQKLNLAPSDARSAAIFAHDGETQNFVELEAGGKPKFTEMLRGELYSPYWWETRLFKARETAEARIRFKPDGTPYGFVRIFPESAPGPALDASAARSIAEQRAREDWGVDLAPYKLLEQSQVQRPNGRVDHQFVYERMQENLGDGRYRLRLSVAGEQFNGLIHFVFVPEAFERRFAEMRAANNAIARVAGLVAGLLYGLGGCILGTLWLLRRRSLVWRPALAAAAVVAGLNAAAVLANAPQAWYSFDTAQSAWVFWGQQIGLALVVFVGSSLLLALVFMAAESLSRRAFPDHPQLWQLWSSAAAPTPSVLGRTVGGYLFVPIELAFIAGFYFVTNRYFGWWQPSESLSDPNILGSALPALAPIGMALQAGFMEECLFRAVPLSIAALIGERLGHRRLAIALALVLQAVVFGAAHANYPGFPAYSRLVELIVPAFIWGLIFLRFGLLPTVILHAVFDLILMSLPVFLVEGPLAQANQALVIVACFVPLAVVLLRRARAGAWLALGESMRNAGWQPSAAQAAEAVAGLRAAAGAWTARVQRALPLLAVLGLAAVVLAGDYRSDALPQGLSRGEAEAAADAGLKNRGVTLGLDWTRMSSTRLAPQEADGTSWAWNKFVWREAGREAYKRLMGTWLAPPLWEVRYARFDEGNVADRAEEWRVTIDGEGKVRQVQHRLPEKRPGAHLTREEARALAQREIQQHFGLEASALREVAAEEEQRPARSDWQFTYADPRVDVGKGGEARVRIAIAGDEIIASGRYVFIPEDWQRAERERTARLNIVRMSVALALVIVAIAALIAAIIAWSRGRFDRRAFWLAAGIVATTSLIGGANQWPVIAMTLNTTEPYAWQVLLWAAGAGFSVILLTLLTALLAGVASWAARAHASSPIDATALWWRGAAAGLFVAGVKTLASAGAPQSFPHWPRSGAEVAWAPWLAALAAPIGAAITTAAVTVIVLYWIDRLTQGWHRHRVAAFLLLALASAAQAALAAEDWTAVAVAGVAGGILYTLLFATLMRFDFRLVPGFAAAQAVVALVVQAVLQQTRAGATYVVLQIVVTLLVSWGIVRYLVRSAEPAHAAPARPLPTT
jgi:hypothetical protein